MKLLTIRQIKKGKFRSTYQIDKKVHIIIDSAVLVLCFTWLVLGLFIPALRHVWWILILLVGYIFIFVTALYFYCCYTYIGEWYDA